MENVLPSATCYRESGSTSLGEQGERGAGVRFRDWVVGLSNARFAIVTEALIRRVLSAAPRRSKHHDMFDTSAKQRIEVKFSVVRKNHGTKLTADNILQCVAEDQDRLVHFSKFKKSRFVCNIQHVRRGEFDMLYYGLMFADCIKIFRIPAKSISARRWMHAARQTKGNKGERQFHITDANLRKHLRRHLYGTLSYDEAWEYLALKCVDALPPFDSESKQQ
jgi:hypothetical protein